MKLMNYVVRAVVKSLYLKLIVGLYTFVFEKDSELQKLYILHSFKHVMLPIDQKISDLGNYLEIFIVYR